MPVAPLIDEQTIFLLLSAMAGLGLSDEEVDIAIVRYGPVDLDLLQLCKRLHPVYGAPDNKRRTAAARAESSL